MNAQQLKNLFRSTLVAQRSIAQEYTALDAVVDFIVQGVTSGIQTWSNSLTFNTDGSGSGAFCTSNDTDNNIRFWKTKTDGNINHLPPTSPLVTEDSFWKEVSPSDGSAIKEWVAGIYPAGLVIVYYDLSGTGADPALYVLLDSTRPFTSSNLSSETTAGKWKRIGLSSAFVTSILDTDFSALSDSLVDASSILWDCKNRRDGRTYLSSAQTTINLTMKNLLRGGRQTLIVFKQNSADLTIRFKKDYFSTAYLYDANTGDTLGGTFQDTLNALSGPAGTLFVIDINSFYNDDSPTINPLILFRYTTRDALGFEHVSNKETGSSPTDDTTKYPSSHTVYTALAANLASAAAYTDAAIAGNFSYRGSWNGSGGNYPTTGGRGSSGVPAKGDAWEISVACTIQGIDYDQGDIIVAKVNTPGQTTGNWGTSEHNTQQATTSMRGTAMVVDTTTIQTSGTTDDQKMVTAVKFWSGISQLKSQTNTWAAVQTFSSAPVFNSVSASQYLKVDGSKVLTSVSTIPDSDISYSNRSANLVFAGPTSGGAAAPTWRALVASDIPTLNQNTTGQAGSVANALTVDNSSLQLDSGTTYNGSATRTISVKNLGITNAMIANSTISLTAKVTGILPIANGGTNVLSQSSDGVAYFNGTSITTDGNIKWVNGTKIFSLAPQAGATSNTIKFLMNGATGSENLFVGANVGNTTLTSANNVGYGANVLSGLVDANKNTSSGVGALSNNAHNDNSTAFGYQALYNFGSGVVTFGTITGGNGYTNGTYNNVTLTVQSGGTGAIFVAPLVNIIVSGGAVTSVALANSNSNGVLKTTVFTCSAASIGGTGSGWSVPVATVTNYPNTAIGYQAALSMRGGAFNVAVGDNALNNNTVASYNTATGSQAMYSTTSGSNNSAFGNGALYANTTANNNSAFGNYALTTNSTGQGNSAFGGTAMYNSSTGSFNSSFGLANLNALLTGYENSSFGKDGMRYTFDGYYNSTLGNQALYSNLSGYQNTAIGHSAGYNATTSATTIAINAGGSGYTNGTYNNVTLIIVSGAPPLTFPVVNITVSGGAVTAITVVSGGSAVKTAGQTMAATAASIGGTGSGFTCHASAVVTAINNTVIGYNAGASIVNNNNSIVIGASADIGQASGDNQLSIQNMIYGSGNSGTGSTASTGKIGIGQKNPNATLDILGSGSNTTLRAIGIGSGTNKILQLLQSDGTTEILSVKDNGDIKVGLSSSKWGMFGTSPVSQQSVLSVLVNNVTSGGTTSTIADFTDLVIYSNDAAAIRNNIYQLAKKLLALETAYRNYGEIKD